MNFGKALKDLKAGKEVARHAYPGQVVKIVPGHFDPTFFGDSVKADTGYGFELKLTTIRNIKADLFQPATIGKDVLLPYLTHNDQGSNTFSPYAPTMEDLLAEDWFTLEEEA